MNGVVEPIVYNAQPNNNQGSIKVQDLLRRGDNAADPFDMDGSEKINYGGFTDEFGQYSSMNQKSGPIVVKNSHTRTTTNLFSPSQTKDCLTSGLRSSDATREQLSNYVGQLEPRFVKFQANKLVQAQQMPVHSNPNMVNSILTAVQATSPHLIK